ncbi:MAG: hypothetical protein CSA33_01155 [Desulfobulbus propionicus]|nr:MAG: hypothetical protein CSA33_01155 [Desulfobulbus propionicus]
MCPGVIVGAGYRKAWPFLASMLLTGSCSPYGLLKLPQNVYEEFGLGQKSQFFESGVVYFGSRLKQDG